MSQRPENTDIIPPADPFALFGAWYGLAIQHEIDDPNAMALATLGEEGFPSVRLVLMKDYNSSGFTFYTNKESRKGRQLAIHPKAAICFHWKSIDRQVRVEGLVETVSDKESDEYFASRPRGSQIGAWASLQSQHLDERSTLEKRVKEYEIKYDGKSLPRPKHWGGFRLRPHLIEFWQERLFRLHDRVCYHHLDGKWQSERLYP